MCVGDAETAAILVHEAGGKRNAAEVAPGGIVISVPE
jgi:hypothetical protein